MEAGNERHADDVEYKTWHGNPYLKACVDNLLCRKELDDNPYLTGFVGRLTGGEVYGKHLLASAGMLSRNLRNLQASEDREDKMVNRWHDRPEWNT